MKSLSFKLINLFIPACLLIYQTVAMAQDWTDSDSANATENTSGDPFGGDPFGGMLPDSNQNRGNVWDTSSSKQNSQQTFPDDSKFSGSQDSESQPVQTPSNVSSPVIPNSNEPSMGIAPVEQNSSSQNNEENPVQDAVIEGIQLTSEKGELPNEKIISCYFIFRDKPTSYFYEVKLRDKKIIFDFNDTKTGSSPVPTTSELPIKGFTIEQKKVDANKDVKGLKPEWHDMIRISFDMEAVPQIHVNDEYSIISYSFKWTTDPAKLSQYIVKDNTPKVILWSSVGVGGVGLGALAWYFLKPGPTEQKLGPLDVGDLPRHPQFH